MLENGACAAAEGDGKNGHNDEKAETSSPAATIDANTWVARFVQGRGVILMMRARVEIVPFELVE